MQNVLRLMVTVLIAAAAAHGCSWRRGNDSDHEKIVLKASPVEFPGRNKDLYRLELYFVTELQNGRDEPLDFWRFFDETVVRLPHRRLLAANGLRVAVGGELAIKRLNTMIVNQPNVGAHLASTVQATPQHVLKVPLGVILDDCMVLYEAGDGALSGREFTKATTMVRFRCRAAERPNHTVIRIGLQIAYGDPQPKYLPTATGLVLGTELPKFGFNGLETEVTLREGQTLAVGLAPGRPMSIGEYLFAKRRGPETEVTTLLLVPVLESAAATRVTRPATTTGGSGN